MEQVSSVFVQSTGEKKRTTTTQREWNRPHPSSCGRLMKKEKCRRRRQNGADLFRLRVVDRRKKENVDDTNRTEQVSSVFVWSLKKKRECRRHKQNGRGIIRLRVVAEKERRTPTTRTFIRSDPVLDRRSPLGNPRKLETVRSKILYMGAVP